MKNSLKQLLRTPGKTILLFLLVVASTALLVFSSVLYVRTNEQIRQAEQEFTTIGTVEQQPLTTDLTIVRNPCFTGQATIIDYDYGKLLTPETLKFEGAEYLVEPENRPYYVTYLPDLNTTRTGSQLSWRMHTVEFTPLEDSDGSGPVQVEITKVLFSRPRDYQKNPNNSVAAAWDEDHEVGDVINFCQHLSRTPQPLETGKTYIGNLFFTDVCQTHNEVELVAYSTPMSDQCDENGTLIDTGHFGNARKGRIDEVTADFYEPGHRGEDWLKLVEMNEMEDYWFRVLPTNSLDLLPSFHQGYAYIADGRAISAEEFESGAPVCMLSNSFAARNQLEIGDAVTLPLLCAMYGCESDYIISDLPRGLLFDANGEYFEPFWEAEYEIVGTYSLTNEFGGGAGEMATDLILIPMKSVKASDKNNLIQVSPMNKMTASFQIKNGTIPEFDALLHAAVPEASLLTISYDDGGYTNVMSGLQRAKNTAVLLLIAGVLAAVIIAVLLLFFMIVRQKKRTAIELSLGMTKGQCRRSLLAGLLVLVILGTTLGSGTAAVLMERYSTTPSDDSLVTVDDGDFLGPESFLFGFSTRYSQWTAALAEAEPVQDTSSVVLYAAVPIVFVLVLFLLAILLVNRNLKIEPVYLLSGISQ